MKRTILAATLATLAGVSLANGTPPPPAPTNARAEAGAVAISAPTVNGYTSGYAVGNSNSSYGVGGNATAVSGQGGMGGSAFSAPFTSQTVNVSNPAIPTTTVAKVHNVPALGAVYAPASANCRIGIGVQGAGIGFGFGIGSSVLDEGCDTREDVRLLVNMNREAAAVARACQKPELAKALGAECAPAVATGPSVLAPPEVVSQRKGAPGTEVW